MRVQRLLAEGARALRAVGIDSADWDAERLLRHVLDWDRARILAYPEARVPGRAASRYRALIGERARRRPLQHLTGTQAFWKHDFLVTPDVLIPRPETEILVETSLDLLRQAERPLIVDVGTGSGCIALSLAAERVDAEIHATDLSPAALAVARENARRLGLEGRVLFHRGDLLDPVARLSGRVDLLVSNPPYVGMDEVEGLAPEVRDHEPRAALVPSADRFAAYRRLAPLARRCLRPGGHVVLEVGEGMADEVLRILEGSGLHRDRVAPDLAGVARAVIASVPIG